MRTQQLGRMRPVRARLLESRRKPVRVGVEPGTWGGEGRSLGNSGWDSGAWVGLPRGWGEDLPSWIHQTLGFTSRRLFLSPTRAFRGGRPPAQVCPARPAGHGEASAHQGPAPGLARAVPGLAPRRPPGP